VGRSIGIGEGGNLDRGPAPRYAAYSARTMLEHATTPATPAFPGHNGKPRPDSGRGFL